MISQQIDRKHQPDGHFTVILVNPGHDLAELKQSMEALTVSSPNWYDCQIQPSLTVQGMR